jgi:glucose uptake protein GlcU
VNARREKQEAKPTSLLPTDNASSHFVLRSFQPLRSLFLMMQFSGKCDDTCGFLAAIFGAICYGSYGVPIKATASIDTHPLVVQSYKTFVVFATSLLVLLAEERPRWSSYGLLSGLLWVGGGTLGILAIRNAGIATAVGTWSSIMVIINFVWGILVFHEPVHSLPATCGAFVCLGMGLVGMTKFASPGRNDSTDDEEIAVADTKEIVPIIEKEGATAEENRGLTSRLKRGASDAEEANVNSSIENQSNDDFNGDNDGMEKGAGKKKLISKLLYVGRSFNPWQTGVIYAVLNGVLSGSSLVPLHYAKLEGISDLSYYISFTSGALVANSLLWAVFLLSNFIDAHEIPSIAKTYESMPQWHFKQLWFRLLIAGLLSNGGMFGGIVATSSLGQAVGNSLIQLKIFISGLWGICYYREAKDRQSTINWFLSATVCVASILCLTYERRKIEPDV